MKPTWYLNNDQLVWEDQMRLYHAHRTCWTLDDTNTQLWPSWAGIRAHLVSGVVGSVECEIEYDSDPAVEAKDSNTTLRLKLGYQW